MGRLRLRPLTILLGKGGVGRSTVASALGLLSSKGGAKTAIVEVSQTSSISSMFGKPPPSSGIPLLIAPNLWTIRVTWWDALREYALQKLYFNTAFRLVFENPFVKRLLPAIPGLPEIVIIGKVVYMATEGEPHIGRLDCVILDGPATGHGIPLLSAPFVISEAVYSGPLKSDANRLGSFLSDKRKTSVHIVTTPEEMPITEAIELIERTQPMGYSLGPVVVNACQTLGLTPSQRDVLSHVSYLPEEVKAVIRVARFLSKRRDVQDFHILRLKRKGDIITLPEVMRPDGRDRIEILAEHLEANLSKFLCEGK